MTLQSHMNGGMDRRLFGFLLVATVVLAEEQGYGGYKRDVPHHGQAFSYSHVIHDHGPPVPQHVGGGYLPQHHHHPNTVVQTITKQVPYPVLQPYAVTVEKHIPYAVNVPVAVPVDRPYPVPVPKPYPVTVVRPVPVTVERPYPYAVKYPVKVPVPTPVPVAVPKPYTVFVSDHPHDKNYSDAPQYEEDGAALDYSSSAEVDEHDR